MSDELRAPLVDACEQLATELATGNFGDPHVAFAVFVHPDSAPTIAVLSSQGVLDIADIEGVSDDEEHDEASDGGRFFTGEDVGEARDALYDAHIAMVTWKWQHARTGIALGAHVAEWVKVGWQRRREYAMDRAMQKAAHEVEHPAVCDQCRRRFTERGLKMHLARSRRCGVSS